MYIVYYDKNVQYTDKSEYVKIHKRGCEHHTKNDSAFSARCRQARRNSIFKH